MLDYVAYLAAQRQPVDLSREALPDAPVSSDRAVARASMRPGRVRQGLSLALRRLADLIEPEPNCAEPALGPC